MATQISRKTAELMAKKIRAKLDALYTDQESHPSKSNSGNKYPGGGTINPNIQYNIMQAYQNAGDYTRFRDPLNPVGSMGAIQYDPNITGGGHRPEDYNNLGSVLSTPSRNSLAAKGQAMQNNAGTGRAVSPATMSVQAPNQGGAAQWDTPEAKQQFLSDQLESQGLGQVDPGAFIGYGGSNAPGLGGLPQGLNLKSGVMAKGANGQSQYNDPNSQGGGNGTDWAGIAGGIASFAPGLYNLANAFKKPEVERPQDYYNPQYNNAMSLMRNRRYDVRPQLEQNLLNQNTYNRNLRNTASSRGELMSNMGGGYGNRLRSDSAAFAQKNTMDNQYRAEEAQLRSALGQQRAQTNMQVGDWNARNRVAQRNYGAAAAENIGTAASMLLRNRNQRSADNLRGQALGAMSTHLDDWMPGLEEMFKKQDKYDFSFKKRVKVGG